MAHQHFSIHPGPVDALADDFASSGDRLGDGIRTFAARAENVDDAFGVMSESTQALSAYVEMTRSTVTALEHLRTGFQQYADSLRHTVAAYQATDSAHARQLGGK